MDLKRKDKIILLQAIADGSVDKKQLSPVTFVCCKRRDWLVGILIASAQSESGSGNVLFIAEVKDIVSEYQYE